MPTVEAHGQLQRDLGAARSELADAQRQIGEHDDTIARHEAAIRALEQRPEMTSAELALERETAQ